MVVEPHVETLRLVVIHNHTQTHITHYTHHYTYYCMHYFGCNCDLYKL